VSSFPVKDPRCVCVSFPIIRFDELCSSCVPVVFHGGQVQNGLVAPEN